MQRDSELFALINREDERQRTGLELIASENFASAQVREACASRLTNKYAEGYPLKRYYGGCDVVDQIEQLALDRAKALVGCPSANGQPHSGAQANMAAYLALAEPGATFMGMNLASGGHLTHGSPVNFSGRLYKVVAFDRRRDTELLDYDQIEQLAQEHRPRIIVAGFTAYERIIDFPRFRHIADSIGAYLVVDMAHFAGLVAGGVYPSPFPHAHVVTTTTHKTLRGPRGGMVLTNEKELADKINKSVFPGVQGGPLEHIIAAKAGALFEALHPEFKSYAAQIVANARALAQELARRGLRLVSGGTDTHLFLVDLRPVHLTGKQAQAQLDTVGITVNKNAIPFDPESPFVTSGLRIGTPAVTTRGMGEPEMGLIADLLYRGLTGATPPEALRAEVRAFASQFPLP
ncbi:MAG: serine hydroxymethyltransferase [Deinococcus sp.]|nr:serine hydroxymethyltransferase [Deinococcus sp.]